jgi:hypothetical protein
MRSSLRERFEPRVRIQDVTRVRSGSPVQYRLRAEPAFTKTISAARALAKRGVPLAAAKRTVERLIAEHEVAVTVPIVEDRKAFEREMAEFGLRAVTIATAIAASK